MASGQHNQHSFAREIFMFSSCARMNEFFHEGYGGQHVAVAIADNEFGKMEKHLLV